MKRCYFIGMSSIFDTELVPQLSAQCDALVRQEDAVEFWFFGNAEYSYISACLALVVGLKSKYPEKDLKVIRVYDPIAGREPSDWYHSVYDARFPCYLVDRYVYAPLMEEGVAQIKEQFVQQFNKVERWVLRQMDVVYAYYYPNLEDSVIRQIEFAQRSCKAAVVRIFSEETEQFIQEKTDELLDERSKIILSMLSYGVPQREIGQVVGVSTSRIGQIAHKAAHSIHEKLLRRYRGAMTPQKEKSCAFFGLKAECNAFQLVAFECFLEYLITRYKVGEFWIDEKSCNTAYGAVLAKYCGSWPSRGVTAKVVVCLWDDDEVDAWSQCICKYVPPFGSVVNLGLESYDVQSFCGELVRHCACLVTDFSGSQADMIRGLCAKAEGKYLFDISRNCFAIDEQFE